MRTYLERAVRAVRFFALLTAALVLAFGFSQPQAARADLLALSEERIEVATDLGLFEFPLWYMDAKELMLRACLDNPDFCLQELEEPVNGEEPILAGLEFIYWAAEADMSGLFTSNTNDNPRARFIFALEAFAEPGALEGDPPVVGVFNAFVADLRGLIAGATYTIFHPFSEGGIQLVAENNGRIRFEDPPHPEGEAEELFLLALTVGPIQHFLYSDTLLPIEEPLGSGNFYIGNPTVEGGHTIFGSPFGRNFVRLEGPGLPGGAIQTNLFVVGGQIFFNEGQNLAPLANIDVATTRVGEPVVIDVLANDLKQGDVPINPTSLEKAGAIIGPNAAQVTAVRELDKVLLRLTPLGAGMATFTYTAETFTGLADTAQVSVFVENLIFNQAEYRARTGKWSLNGASNFRDLVATSGTQSVYLTTLHGAQEVPPRTSAASGDFSATFDSAAPDSFTYELEIQVPPETTITQAHIHVGDVGVNGPIIFFLCTNLGNAPLGTVVPLCENINGVISVSGTLSANELQAAGGITTFAEAVGAIQNGGTYVNVHSVVFPPGEIRGQIGRNVISLRMGENGPALGAAEVQAGDGPNLPWSFSGKSVGSLGVAPHVIHAESALDNGETRNLVVR